MFSSLDPKSTDTLHRNRDCSANSGSTETKTIIWRLRTRKIRQLRVFENKTTLTLYMYCEFRHHYELFKLFENIYGVADSTPPKKKLMCDVC